MFFGGVLEGEKEGEGEGEGHKNDLNSGEEITTVGIPPPPRMQMPAAWGDS